MDLSYDTFQKTKTVSVPTLAQPISDSGGLNLSFEQFQASKSPTFGITSPLLVQNFPGTTQTLADLQLDPLSLKADPHKAITDAANSLFSSDTNLRQSLSDLFSSKSISQGIGNTAKVVAGSGNVLFSPLSALFSAANDIPGLASLSKLITLPFQAVGETAPHVSNTLIDALPISAQAKADLKPGIGEIFSLASQIALGEVVDLATKTKELTTKYGPEDAKTIVDKAQELATEKKVSEPIAKPTPTDLSYETFQKSPEAKAQIGLDSLAQEARKYKSAEEFVKAQGGTVYHGTSANFEAFDNSMKGSITGAESAKGAIWFTDDPATAKAYSVYAAEDGVINKLMEQAIQAEKVAQKSGLESDWKKYDALTQEMEKQDTYDANLQRRNTQANVKEAVVKGDFYTVDAKGKSPQELSKDGNIDSWLNQQLDKARKLGKDGVVFKNLDDAVGLYNKPSTHYAIFDSKNIQTKSQLTDFYNKATNSSIPTENIKPSKIGLNIQAKAIEAGLTEGFKDTAGYNPTTVKLQAERIANLLQNDPNSARDIISGKKPLPNNISGSYLIKAMEDRAIKTGDVKLLKDLATSPLTSETSFHAQELRLAGEREQGSPLSAIQEIMKARENSVMAKIKDIAKAKAEIVKEVKTSIRKTATTRQSWSDFVSSIQC